MAANSKELIEKDLAELKSRLEQNSFQNVLADTERELKLLENTTLHIAFTGNTGAGKSSLVNAFRNMTDYEEGSAKTGVTETTLYPKSYPHPEFPAITLWDLPGIGTNDFNPKEYLAKVNFSTYDIFIFVTSVRFNLYDTLLASEIQRLNKRFYFVRTKVDQDMANEGRKPNFSEKRTLEEIRTSCISNLMKEGIFNPRVFLISRWDSNKYDFPILQKTVANDLNDFKRPLLIKAMPAFSTEYLQEKKVAMEALIWKKALVSCGVGMVFVPGLSVVCDTAILVSTMQEICKAFGLDDESLCNLSGRVGKPVDVLKSAIQKTPMAKQINSEFVRSLLTKYLLCGFARTVGEVARYIPGLGSLVGGVTSFTTTHCMLKNFLEDTVEDAKSVLEKAAE